MPSLRAEVLKKVFKKGIDSISKEELEGLFKTTKNKLFRREANPEALIKGGFEANASRFHAPYDQSGIYYGRTPKSVEMWTGETPNVTGISRPGATTSKGSYGLTLEEMEKEAGGSDFVHRALGGIDEVIQKKPHNVLAKITNNEGNSAYRILGLASALGAGGVALNSDEAEAFPIGKLLKAGTKGAATMASKAIAGAGSSTEKALKGQAFEAFGGRTIQSITKGSGDKRIITFTDESVAPVTKDVLHDLMRQRGTQAKMTEFATKDTEGQLAQAYKSLQFHESRAWHGHTEKTIRSYHKDFVKNLKDAGQEVPAMSLVRMIGKKESFTMPTAYADLLEKEGVLKVVERFK